MEGLDGVRRVSTSLLVGDAVTLETRSRGGISLQTPVRAGERMRHRAETAGSLVRNHASGGSTFVACGRTVGNDMRVTAAVTRYGCRRKEDSEGCFRCWEWDLDTLARLRAGEKEDLKHDEPQDRL